MSIGNTKSYGNKGNNFPFQSKVLKGLSLGKLNDCLEIVFSEATASALEASINVYITANPQKYLISKAVVYDSTTPAFVAFITFAEL
jgi:hypothetical protein